MVEIDLTVLQAALTPELAEVSLIPGLTSNVDPETLPTVPFVMPDFELVASAAYRYGYNSVRYLNLGYFLERGGQFESGEFHVLSPAVPFAGQAPDNYVPPTLTFTRTVLQQTAGSLGVDFEAIFDATTFPSNPSFGLAYKITNASPVDFPRLRTFVLKILPLISQGV